MKKFKVTLALYVEAENAEDAQNEVLRQMAVDEIEIDEVVAGVFLQPRLHRYADVDIKGECAYGRRASEAKCHEKGTHNWAGRPYCRDHFYKLAGVAS